MTDYFALLGEPRRPWIDPDELKKKFLELSSEVHPDRTHQALAAQRQEAERRYSELNSAYNCLREPKERLRHLIEMERGGKPTEISSIPPEMMEEFLKVGQLCKLADALLAEKAQTASPVLKVRLFEQGQELSGQLGVKQQEIKGREELLFKELKTINAKWEANDSETGSKHKEQTLRRLEEIYRLLGYFARWSEQIRERMVQLAF